MKLIHTNSRQQLINSIHPPLYTPNHPTTQQTQSYLYIYIYIYSLPRIFLYISSGASSLGISLASQNSHLETACFPHLMADQPVFRKLNLAEPR